MKYFYNAAIIIGIIFLGMIALTPQTSPMKLGDSGVPNSLTSLTNTSVTVGATASTQVLAANSGRVYANICNPTAGTSTYLTASSAQNASGTTVGVAATSGIGIYLPAYSCYKIDSSNLIRGIVNGWASASTTLTVIYQ